MLTCEQTDVMDFFSPPESPPQGDVVREGKGPGSSAWCGISPDGEPALGIAQRQCAHLSVGWGVGRVWYLREVKGIKSYRSKVFFQIS